MINVIRTWFKCICGCSWYADNAEGQECPECGGYDFKIIDEEDVTDLYSKQESRKGVTIYIRRKKFTPN